MTYTVGEYAEVCHADDAASLSLGVLIWRIFIDGLDHKIQLNVSPRVLFLSKAFSHSFQNAANSLELGFIPRVHPYKVQR